MSVTLKDIIDKKVALSNDKNDNFLAKTIKQILNSEGEKEK